MSRTKSGYPTELELIILKLLWQDSPLTARQIREQLANRGRTLAHTSVITTLQKMVDKKQLKQLSPVEGKAFRFEPIVAADQISKNLLGDVVQRVFDGSPEAVMLSLFDVSDLDAESLKRMKAALNQKIREKKQ